MHTIVVYHSNATDAIAGDENGKQIRNDNALNAIILQHFVNETSNLIIGFSHFV